MNGDRVINTRQCRLHLPLIDRPRLDTTTVSEACIHNVNRLRHNIEIESRMCKLVLKQRMCKLVLKLCDALLQAPDLRVEHVSDRRITQDDLLDANAVTHRRLSLASMPPPPLLHMESKHIARFLDVTTCSHIAPCTQTYSRSTCHADRHLSRAAYSSTDRRDARRSTFAQASAEARPFPCTSTSTSPCA